MLIARSLAGPDVTRLHEVRSNSTFGIWVANSGWSEGQKTRFLLRFLDFAWISGFQIGFLGFALISEDSVRDFYGVVPLDGVYSRVP